MAVLNDCSLDRDVFLITSVTSSTSSGFGGATTTMTPIATTARRAIGTAAAAISKHTVQTVLNHCSQAHRDVFLITSTSCTSSGFGSATTTLVSITTIAERTIGTAAAAISTHTVQTATTSSSINNVFTRFGATALWIIITLASAMVVFRQAPHPVWRWNGDLAANPHFYAILTNQYSTNIKLLNFDLTSTIILYYKKLAGFLHSLSHASLLTMESSIFYIIQKPSSIVTLFLELFCPPPVLPFVCPTARLAPATTAGWDYPAPTARLKDTEASSEYQYHPCHQDTHNSNKLYQLSIIPGTDHCFYKYFP